MRLLNKEDRCEDKSFILSILLTNDRMVSVSDFFSKKWFRRDILTILGFLVLQFILGMTLNLFVTFPNIPIGSSDQIYFNAIFTTPFLLVHFIVGIGLLLGSIWVLISARHTKVRSITVTAVIGFIAILVAYVSGFEFLLSGFQNNIFSFTMSIGFIVALIAYYALFNFSNKLK